MRLPPDAIAAIKREAAAVYGEAAEVRLFGSRVDDSRRGGDIDLHLEVPAGRDTVTAELEFGRRLWRALGERRIDVTVHEAGRPDTPIDEIARAEGVVL